MTQFSVRHFARFVTRHPNWCLLITVLLTVASILAIRDRLTIKMDVAALLPEDSPVVKTTEAAVRDFGSFDFLVAVVESSEPSNETLIRRAADELAYALDDRSFIREVTHKITPDALEIGTAAGDALAVAVLTEADWEVLTTKLTDRQSIVRDMKDLRAKLNAAFVTDRQRRKILEDPLNVYSVLSERVKIKSGPLKSNMDLRDPYFISRDGEMLLILAWPIRPATDLQFAQNFSRFLDDTRIGIYNRNPEFGDPAKGNARIHISFFGSHYEAIADSKIVKNDFFNTSIASFIAVICLFFFAFRRPEALIFIAIPLITGVIWTLGLTSILIGRLTQVTMAFGAILIGLGIDFSVHIYNRYLEELRRGRKNHEAIRFAVMETGPGIIAGALTTAIAFFGMMISSFVGFRELGLVAGMGILCCLVAVLMLLPAMLGYFGRGPVGEFTRRPMSTLGLRRFHYTITAYPRTTLLVGLVVAVFLGSSARDITFEDDFRSLRQPSDEYRALQARIESKFQVPPNQIVVIITADNLEDALRANDQLYRNVYAAERSGYEMLAIDSLRYYIPSNETQRRQLERMSSQDLDTIQARIHTIANENGINPMVFNGFMTRLREIQSAARDALARNETPIDLASESIGKYPILAQIASSYIYSPADEVRIVTRLYPPHDSVHDWVSSIPTPFKKHLSEGIREKFDITGSVTIQEDLRALITRDLAKVVLVVLACVIVYLIVYFENLFRALLAVFPVVLALICMLGTVHLFGMQLHYLNIISLPMIVGIGVDSGIHLLQRYHENDKRDMYMTITRTGRAVVITTLTTIFGFGSLALANFRGIRELGLFAIIGVSFTMLTTLLVLPAVLQLLNSGKRPAGNSDDELE